jgi:hypothetical protein
MKQHTPPIYRYIRLLISLMIMMITLQDGLANRLLSREDASHVGPTSRLVAQDLLGPLNHAVKLPSEEFGRRGIKEVIRDKYRKRYEAWKNEFLSTETGRSQWEKYANTQTFLLTITVSDDKPHDARTDRYEWTNSGTLSAATIILGSRIDEGYPSTENYPVTGSLASRRESASRRSILAASKFAHEFGHVNQALANGQFQRQRQLLRTYITITLAKGHEKYDPRLTELAQQLGATPLQVWTDWECLAETNALLYLQDKVSQKLLPPSLLKTIANNVTLNAKGCPKAFGPALLVKSKDRI